MYWKARHKKMAKTGKNSDEKKREQTRLLGRRKRVHKGEAARRGKGRTTHGFRG